MVWKKRNVEIVSKGLRDREGIEQPKNQSPKRGINRNRSKIRVLAILLLLISVNNPEPSMFKYLMNIWKISSFFKAAVGKDPEGGWELLKNPIKVYFLIDF